MTKRDDELGPRLEQLITALAAEDARTVVEEARAAARERAKAIIEEALAEQILRHAAGDVPAPQPAGPMPSTARDAAPPPAPASPAEGGSGLYVFGIVGADAHVPAEELGVELLADGDLAAVVRTVPLAEFGEEALRRNLEDMGWLEKTARAHEEVLDALVRATTLVPLRLCTVFRDAQGVRGMLRDEAPGLAEALERLAGTTEWGVKIVADRSKLAAAGETNGGGGGEGEGEGARFLAARRRAQELAAEADQLINVAVGEAHARLAEEARDAVVHPAQSRELAGYEGEMVLNGSYLVEDERIGSFHGLVDELASRYEPAGLSFSLTGPWAPYNFVAARGDRNPSHP